MSMYKNLTTICAAAALALGLAACGGGGGGSNNQADMTPPPDPTPPPMEYDVALPAGHGLADGMTTIDAGETVMLSSGTYLTCPGTADCTLTVSTDGVTGASSASSTGGMVAITTEATRMAAAREAERQLHLEHQNTLSAAETELERVQGLYDAGDATANELAAAQKAVDDAMMLAGNQPPPMTPPTPVAASGSLVIPAAAQGELAFVLPNPGDTDTIDIPAGETVYRRGVGFTCDSDYDCTVTVTNSLGTIVASWSSEELEDGDMAGVTAMYASGGIRGPHGLPATQANLVKYYGWSEEDLPASGERITRFIPAGEARRVGNGVFSCPAGGPGCIVNIRNTLGTYSIWWSRAMPTYSWAAAPDLPPVDTFAELNDGSADDVRNLVAPAADPLAPVRTATELTGMDVGGAGVLNADDAALRSLFDPNGAAFGTGGDTAAAPGATPTLTGGSTLSSTEAIDGGDIAAAPAGWAMATLFADWGDTVGTGDGGFETGAIVVNNFEEGGTPHVWDADLAGRFVNGGAEYALTIDSDTTTGNDSVAFTVDATNAAPAMSQIDAGATGGAVLNTQVGSAADAALRRVEGTYRGVRGSYTCGTGSCIISRATGGSTAYTIGNGAWQFRPDPGSMVQVPDQDWLVYGAWMTTPDNGTGTHRIGTLFNGFDPYAGANDVFTIGNDNGLHGTATYTGGAAGIYVDGDDSGLFTAEASLTANFDVDGDGTADDGDYTLSGRIDNFRGTDGVYLGDDTQSDPNHPTAGENDWVVTLGEVNLTALTAGAIGETATSGSADGVPWAGNWNGQLFGPGDTAEDGVAPTGIAGQFSAATAAAGTPAARTTGVVGAFGATR